MIPCNRQSRHRGGVKYSLTSALEGVGGQHHAPAALPPGKTPCTHSIGWLAGVQGRSANKLHI